MANLPGNGEPKESEHVVGCAPGDGELEKPFLPEAPRRHSRIERRDKRLKKFIRHLKFISRLLSFMMSCVVVGMMVNTIVTYFNSRTAVIDGMNAWPPSPKIWPTLMMLGVASLALISNGIVVAAYVCSHKAANDASKVASFFSTVTLVIHLVVWAVAAGLFKQQNAYKGVSNDLWSWSCSPSADARAEAFKKLINYDFLCKSNLTTWYVSLANVGLGVVTLAVYLLALARVRSKRRVLEAQAAGGGSA